MHCSVHLLIAVAFYRGDPNRLMFKGDLIDGDVDPLRALLQNVKSFFVDRILPDFVAEMGCGDHVPPGILTEIMAVAAPPEADAGALTWQQLHRDALTPDPYSILCAVTNEYYFDLRATNDEGSHTRVRMKMDAGEMTIIRGNLPHSGGPTTAFRLHLAVKFSDESVRS